MDAFYNPRAKRTFVLSLQSRIAAMLCGAVFLALSANAALADTNSAIDKLMGDAISQSQKMVSLMTQSCGGGEHGVNPNHYDEFVNHSNEVQKTLVDLRLRLAKGEAPNAGPQIDAVEATLERMIGLMAGQCSGGAHGRNPNHFGDIVNMKNRVLGSLDAVKAILAG
jgi:hypothetical protein